jgi:hypothetical protein
VFCFLVCLLDKCGCGGDLIGFLVAREISGRVFLCEMIRVSYQFFGSGLRFLVDLVVFVVDAAIGTCTGKN